MNTKIYDAITARICDLLNQGIIPWRKPWEGGKTAWPVNFVSGKPYQGINVFVLHCAGFTSRHWLTFKQIQEKGGRVKKGSKGFPVIFWKILDRSPDALESDETTGGKIPLLRFYTVFNLEQVEGIDIPDQPPIQNPNFTPIQAAENIIANMPLRPEIIHQGRKAFYSPSLDRVTLPAKEFFHNEAGYYGTQFHELTHATGHSSRLGRSSNKYNVSFGDENYSREDLVAEMGASFLTSMAGLELDTIENSAAYIASWLKVFEGDEKILITAAAQAQKACNYILNE